MFPWQEMIRFLSNSVLTVYTDGLFWVITALVGYQYWQLQKSQQRMFGYPKQPIWHCVVPAVVLGSAGGFVASFLLTVIGINVNRLGMDYIWPFAFAMMLFNTRLLCIAYAGGFVALLHIVLGWPDVEPPQILTLIAILHFTESFLVAISGRYGAVPIFLKLENGRMVGAFNLQNFWPLPLVLMAAISIPDFRMPVVNLGMPDWWPLVPFGMNVPEGHKWVYVLLPIVAALGYTDIAVASSPTMRRRQSALNLAIYSSVLLTLALLSVRWTWLQPVAAIVAPWGHEWMIRVNQRRELLGMPRYVPPGRGMMILDVLPGSAAKKAGLQSGDIVLGIEGVAVDGRQDLSYCLKFVVGAGARLTYVREGQEMVQETWISLPPSGERVLGIVPVPEGGEYSYLEISANTLPVWNWIKQRIGKAS